MICHNMTSSNGTFSGLLALLGEESTCRRWIPLIKASDAELWCFLCVPEQKSEQTVQMFVIWDTMASLWRHCNEPNRQSPGGATSDETCHLWWRRREPRVVVIWWQIMVAPCNDDKVGFQSNVQHLPLSINNWKRMVCTQHCGYWCSGATRQPVTTVLTNIHCIGRLHIEIEIKYRGVQGLCGFVLCHFVILFVLTWSNRMIEKERNIYLINTPWNKFYISVLVNTLWENSD